MVLDTSALIGYNVNMKDNNTNWTIAIIGASAAVSCVVYLYVLLFFLFMWLQGFVVC